MEQSSSEDEPEDAGNQYEQMDDQDEDDSESEKEEGDQQFDHLVPQNWQEIADMRLRMLDKEYAKCMVKSNDLTEVPEFEYKGLNNVLGLQQRLDIISN